MFEEKSHRWIRDCSRALQPAHYPRRDFVPEPKQRRTAYAAFSPNAEPGARANALAWPVFRERLLRSSSFVFRKGRDHARARGSSVTFGKKRDDDREAVSERRRASAAEERSGLSGSERVKRRAEARTSSFGFVGERRSRRGRSVVTSTEKKEAALRIGRRPPTPNQSSEPTRLRGPFMFATIAHRAAHL